MVTLSSVRRDQALSRLKSSLFFEKKIFYYLNNKKKINVISVTWSGSEQALDPESLPAHVEKIYIKY